MTNHLVGDVYARIIEDVIAGSKNEFEQAGVSQNTLTDLQQAWQSRLSNMGVAQMPWDPKPVVQPPPPAPAPVANGLPSSTTYPSYEPPPQPARVKPEPANEHQYNGLPNGYPQQPAAPTQGGLARAQQLVQQQYGTAANASLNAMQRGGLALPGQNQQTRPQGMQMPAQAQQAQHHYQQQQHAAMQQRQQQQQYLQQQQSQPRIKVENDSPRLQQNGFQQQPNYTQTDGADDGMEQWQNMLAQHRAANAEQRQRADNMMRDHIMQQSADLQSGLMMPLNELPSGKRQKRTAASSSFTPSSMSSTIPQLDGEVGKTEEEKPDIKDEDDENAINSDLDDDDDNGQTGMGDEDGEELDNILCVYDKVQRVKNKWKCVLKDGIMKVNGKEWVFHKGTGEFEW